MAKEVKENENLAEVSTTKPLTQHEIEQKMLGVALPGAAWNVVLKALGELPLKESGEVALAIKNQALSQIYGHSAAKSSKHTA